MRPKSTTLCSIVGCGSPSSARGWCGMHYMRWRRRGDPNSVRLPGRYPQPTEERFWNMVNKTDTCWLWTGCTAGRGYGLFGVNRKLVRPHRYAYELLVGPIPEGLQIDHLCPNRGCVNPAHLRAVTAKVNILGGNGVGAINARKTHCRKGHPYDKANTRVNKLGYRSCRTCDRIRAR